MPTVYKEITSLTIKSARVKKIIKTLKKLTKVKFRNHPFLKTPPGKIVSLIRKDSSCMGTLFSGIGAVANMLFRDSK